MRHAFCLLLAGLLLSACHALWDYAGVGQTSDAAPDRQMPPADGNNERLLRPDLLAPAEFGSAADLRADSVLWPHIKRQYVVSSLTLPAGAASQCSFDLSGDGLLDNNLGDLINSVAVLAPDLLLLLQEGISEMILIGAQITLVELESTFAGTAPLKALVGPGAPTSCCLPGTAISACFCYDGTGSFSVDPAIPPTTFTGQVQASELDSLVAAAAAEMTLRLVIFPGIEQVFPLKQAQLWGKLVRRDGQERIASGKVGGYVPLSVIISFFAKVFSRLCDNDSHGLRSTLEAQFGGDCAISEEEILANPLLQVLLLSLPDIDADGEKDFTIGVGMTAVQASISW